MDQHTREKQGSISEAGRREKDYQKEKVKEQNFLKIANHRVSWGAGIVFALIPILSCKIGLLLHPDNQGMIDNYNKFTLDFYNTGSFLWISITILVMSLLELLLNGFKKNLKGKKRTYCNIFIITSALFVFYAVHIYLDNISSPINATTVQIISWIAFVLFAVSSGIISFAIVREV